MLGLDPLYLANEGKVIVIADDKAADKVVETIKQESAVNQPQIIGEVIEEAGEEVYLQTELGGTRTLGLLANQLLPRIC